MYYLVKDLSFPEFLLAAKSHNSFSNFNSIMLHIPFSASYHFNPLYFSMASNTSKCCGTLSLSIIFRFAFHSKYAHRYDQLKKYHHIENHFIASALSESTIHPDIPCIGKSVSRKYIRRIIICITFLFILNIIQ